MSSSENPGPKLSHIVPFLKVFVFSQNVSSTHTLKASQPSKPVSYLPHSSFIVAAMRFDIAASQIGNRCLIPITLLFKYQNYLC